MRPLDRLTIGFVVAVGFSFGPGCSCGSGNITVADGGSTSGTGGASASNTGGTGSSTGSLHGSTGTGTTGAHATGTSTGSGTATGTSLPDAGCGLVTCLSINANCGPIGDGCGGTLQCGTCKDPATCGGGGTPSQCGGQAGCVAKTCLELNVGCGPAGDGCGNLIQCGGCGDGGQTCGGGGVSFQCGGTGGGTATTGGGTGSTAGATSGGTGGSPDAGLCVPLTCADFDAGCGLLGDGCGGSFSCGGCDAGGTCGGGGVPFQCGTPDAGVCVVLTCGAVDAGCGYIGDGCGGVASCGGCDGGLTCGGGGVANQCGSAAADAGSCVGLCTSQIVCGADGGSTSISGTVFAATNASAGFGDPDPIPNATVYIPNGPVQGFSPGAVCDVCGAPVSGDPLVITTSMEDGGFSLANVPVTDAGFELVIQVGRWRRIVQIPPVAACANTSLTADQTRLPRNHTEGDIPLIAMVTGDVDSTECVLRKMGIDDAEFTAPGVDAGRVQLWVGNGTQDPQKIDAQELTLTSSLTSLEGYDQVILACTGSEYGQPVSPDAGAAQIAQNQQNLIDYTNAGGRVYATHYSYVWLDNDRTVNPSLSGPVPFSSTADWDLNAGSWGDTCAGSRRRGTYTCVVDIDQSFTKGQLLAEWLLTVGASTTLGQIPQLDNPRWDFDTVVPPSENWLQWPGNQPRGETYTPLHYTFNTPVDAGTQCGRVVFSDFHVENPTTDIDGTGQGHTGGTTFPGECQATPMSAQEKVLEFMLFDLASCVTQSDAGTAVCAPLNCAQQGYTCGQAGDGCSGSLQCGGCDAGGICEGIPGTCVTTPPVCNSRTCQEYGFSCGQAGDGCGNLIDCGGCDAGGTCGGGGTPGVCGTAPVRDAGTVVDAGPVCTPIGCTQQQLSCGQAGDGCGNVIGCGGCDAGGTCGGGGTPGVCGSPNCNPYTCQELGYTCGAAGDGCGGVLQCGVCDAGTCGGNFVPNQCGSQAFH